MVLAPGAMEAEVAIGEYAGERDLPDGRRRVASGWRGLERSERPLDLAGLMLDPFRLVLGGITPTALVHLQDRGIHDAVGERLQAQRREARLGLGRNDAAAAREMIEIFEDDAGVEQHEAVVEHERRDLAERVLLSPRIRRIGGA